MPAVTGGDLVLGRRSRLLELWKALEQDADPLGSLGVVAGRMKLGECRMADERHHRAGVQCQSMQTGVLRRPPLVLLVVLYAGVALVLGVVFAASSLVDQQVTDALLDPILVLDGRFGTGVISNLGVTFWCWAAGAAAFAGTVLLRTGRSTGRPLLAVGLLTAFLGLDDLFLGHELFDQKLGIPQPVTYSVYGAAVIAIAYVYREYWRRTEFLLVLPAAIFFTVSVLADVAVHGKYSFTVVEECAKFAGIATWALYVVRTAYLEVMAQLRTAASA